MNYFAMIHWADDKISPVTNESGETELWNEYDEAKAAISEMPIYNTLEITIHDISGE
jgi:hypothetical protein